MMEKTRNLGVKCLFALVALALLLPSVIKFSHILEDHEHTVCLAEHQTHFHEVDLDCEFFKFKLNNDFPFQFETPQLTSHPAFTPLPQQYYTFIKGHQKSTAYLRGPPHAVLTS